MRGATPGAPGSGAEWSRSESRRLNELARKYPSKKHKEVKARCKLIAAELPKKTAKSVARKLRSLQESRAKNREVDAAMQATAAALAINELVPFVVERYVPFGQGVQEDCATSSAKRPLSQTVQVSDLVEPAKLRQQLVLLVLGTMYDKIMEY